MIEQFNHSQDETDDERGTSESAFSGQGSKPDFGKTVREFRIGGSAYELRRGEIVPTGNRYIF